MIETAELNIQPQQKDTSDVADYVYSINALEDNGTDLVTSDSSKETGICTSLYYKNKVILF
jgi:hypothetical protein